ncbi:MAG: amidase [Terriglobales bacterium]
MSALPAETAFLSVAELGQRLRRREFTSLDLTEFFLDRLATVGKKLNLVVTLTDDLARRQARAADEELRRGRIRGPLHGIPYGAKDLLDTAGIRTTWGCPAFADRVPTDDATVIRRLRDAGAVLVAKLAMIELAGAGNYQSASASLTGPARNPWDPTRWTGGSSSGPGGAVAAGLVGFAIGSETWGSIVNPSTYCGIAGLRPTYGRVSRAGAMALSWTMDKLGPMARRVEDLPLILAAIAGPDPSDPTSLNARFAYPPTPSNLHGFRVGYFPAERLAADSPVRPAYEHALAEIRRLGAFMTPTSLPDLPYGDAAGAIVDIEGASAFENLLNGPDFHKILDEGQRIGLYAGAQAKGVEYLRSCKLRGMAQMAMLDYYRQFDVVINIAERSVAPLADEPFDEQDRAARREAAARKSPPSPRPPRSDKNYQLSGSGNLLGFPAVAVSMGFSAAEHMPIGLEIMAAPLAEAGALHVAAVYERAAGWYRHHPQVSA